MRFYRKFATHFAITNLQATAYLRYPVRSKVDGTNMYRQQQLTILGSTGDEVKLRTWPGVTSSMPFTIWIPLGAGLTEERITHVQGRDIVATYDETKAYPSITLFLDGKIDGLGLDMSIKEGYSLMDRPQTGLAASVDVPPGYSRLPERLQRRWRGWDRFDAARTYGVFVYYVRASLSGYRRSWDVCTDNETTKRIMHLDPAAGSRPAIQILFMNITEDQAATECGFVVFVTLSELAELDRREGNYTRISVTGQTAVGGNARVPDIVWTYIGRPERVERARSAIAAGTARIRDKYLVELSAGFAAFDEGLTASPPAGVPAIPLHRVEVASESPATPLA